MKKQQIYIFGASHIGLRLAAKLSIENDVFVIDEKPSPPESQKDWKYICSDYANIPNLEESKIVYVVTDEDKLNIRIALAISNANSKLPITITLTQSRLGKKLSQYITNISYINPSELAASKFVDAINLANPIAEYSQIQHDPDNEVPNHRSHPIDPLILRALAFFIFLALSTTIYFHFAEKFSWIDSWYFVITLMTTVGFGDISLKDSSILSKIIGTLLMIASVTNTAIIFALISDSLLKQRLSLTFGRKKLQEKGHVIVVGLGSVGLKVIEELIERGEKIALIESDINSRFMPSIMALRIPTIIGDAKLDRTMKDAGLKNAKAIICATSSDLSNLEIGLNIKSLNPDIRLVLRIYDHLLAQTLDQQLNIHFALSTSAIAVENLVDAYNLRLGEEKLLP